MKARTGRSRSKKLKLLFCTLILVVMLIAPKGVEATFMREFFAFMDDVNYDTAVALFAAATFDAIHCYVAIFQMPIAFE